MEQFFVHLANIWGYGISTILLMIAGYYLFDLLTPKLDFNKELVENKNVAVAIVIGSFMLSIALVVGLTLIAP